MFLNYAILALLGLGGGFMVAGGTIALIISLKIIPRFASITHTAHNILLYEDSILLGTVAGNIVFLHHPNLPFGWFVLLLYGLFSGIFLGTWIIALAEVVNAFPIFARRAGLISGISWVVITMAVGKVLGSLYYFWKGW